MPLQIVGRPKVGARPVHIYAVNGTAKAWSHSDAEGVFHVITSANTGGNWTFGVKQVKVSRSRLLHVSLLLCGCTPATFRLMGVRISWVVKSMVYILSVWPSPGKKGDIILSMNIK